MAMFSVNDCHEITNMASFYGENDEKYTLVAVRGRNTLCFLLFYFGIIVLALF